MLLFINMIWIFGDSYSVKFGDEKNVCPHISEQYINYKGYVPKMYFELLSEYYNEEYKNFSFGAMDNSFIFLKFMENHNKINNDDIVIFNWTSIDRFKYEKQGNWMSSGNIDYSILSEDTLKELRINRRNDLYFKEQLSIIKFIDSYLKNNKVIHWTWRNKDQINRIKRMELTIMNETNNELMDYHYGEIGQQFLFDEIKNRLINKTNIKIDMDYFNTTSLI